GAHLESTKGAAYVFVWDGEDWTLEAHITSPDSANGDEFGGAVSISGDRAVIGARYHDSPDKSDAGAAYVYVRNETANSWDLEETLKADSLDYFLFGQAVSISGDIIAVGALDLFEGGGVYVYVRNEAKWEKQTVLFKRIGPIAN